jgi:CheY-like chemotaxis protein
LVLLDLKMPRVSGLEVLERMRGDPRFRTIPVVILTSSEEDPDVKKAYELGANSYIVKPIDFERFAEIARQIGAYWLQLNRPPV